MYWLMNTRIRFMTHSGSIPFLEVTSSVAHTNSSKRLNVCYIPFRVKDTSM